MRRPVIAGNWKMNNTWAKSVLLVQSLSNRSDDSWEDIDVVVCPATCNIKAVQSVIDFDRAPIAIGAQNAHWEEEGAFTGEVGIPMIKDIGASYCIVGHSERREMFGETDEMVNKKVRALVDSGLIPIMCVGESLAIRDEGSYLDFVTKQVSAGFAGLDASHVASCIIAYEPIWAIGTGRTATPEQAQEVCRAIRKQVAFEYGSNAAESIRILYGGSMKPENAEDLIGQDDIDGGLIGGASLNADDFCDLIKVAAQ